MQTYPLVNDPSVWKGSEYIGDPSQWTHMLTPAEVAELRKAVDVCKAQGLSGTNVRLADFPLPELGPRIRSWGPVLNRGRGFMLISGQAIAHFSDDDLRTAFYGMGHYFGVPISQNSYGDMLGDVLDEGVKMGTGRVRGYRTNQHLRFHTDRADVVGLQCINASKSGGLSSIVSSTAVFNDIINNHPEYIEPLLNGYIHASTEEGGAVTTYRIPVYSITDGVVSCRILRNTIESARVMGYAVHTELEAAALAYMDSICARPGMSLDMDLQRGDMQFINNYTTLHSRTAFIDHENGPRRHLLRLWLRFSEWPRPVDPELFKDYLGVEKTLSR